MLEYVISAFKTVGFVVRKLKEQGVSPIYKEEQLLVKSKYIFLL